MPRLTLSMNRGISCDDAAASTDILLNSVSNIGDVAGQLNNRAIQRQEVTGWNNTIDCRADLTPVANNNWKIQLQQNGARPSLTYASLTIDSTAVEYINFAMPISPPSWPSDLRRPFTFGYPLLPQPVNYIVARVNRLIALANELRTMLVNAMGAERFFASQRRMNAQSNIQPVPDAQITNGQITNAQNIERRINEVSVVYNTLCRIATDFKNKVIANRRHNFNSRIKKGLYNSLRTHFVSTLSYR